MHGRRLTALPASPLIALEAGRATVRCSTPGCGRKLLGEVAPGTKILSGWVSYRCPRCKTTFYVTHETTETMPRAS